MSVGTTAGLADVRGSCPISKCLVASGTRSGQDDGSPRRRSNIWLPGGGPGNTIGMVVVDCWPFPRNCCNDGSADSGYRIQTRKQSKHSAHTAGAETKQYTAGRLWVYSPHRLVRGPTIGSRSSAPSPAQLRPGRDERNRVGRGTGSETDTRHRLDRRRCTARAVQ